jgi:hypothetical protein
MKRARGTNDFIDFKCEPNQIRLSTGRRETHTEDDMEFVVPPESETLWVSKVGLGRAKDGRCKPPRKLMS